MVATDDWISTMFNFYEITFFKYSACQEIKYLMNTKMYYIFITVSKGQFYLPNWSLKQ